MQVSRSSVKIIPFLVTAFIIIAELAVSFNSVLLPNIKEEFTISNQLAQMTLASGLFALGLSGIIYGGLSDALGRRPLFLFSTILFSLSSLLCSLAPNITLFLCARFLQGVGSGAGWIVGNAALSDIYRGKRYVAVMNYVHAIAGITPAVAPVIGSYLAVALGWRNCFSVLFVFSLFMVLAMFFYLKESLFEKKSISLLSAVKGYRGLFHSWQFVYYVALKAIAVMLIFCEISNIPLLYVEYYHLAPQDYSLYIFPVFIIYILSTIFSGWSIKYFQVRNVLLSGTFLLLLSNAITLWMSFSREYSAVEFQIARSLSYIGWGMIFGNATAKIVSSVPEHAGAASAMMIAIEMLFSSIGIYLLGVFFDGSLRPLSAYSLFSTVLILALLMMIRKKENPSPYLK